MGQYPLVLSHSAIRRITERKAQQLILARRLPRGTREIHDSLVLQRNERARRRGRLDLQDDPLALTIEIEGSRGVGLLELTLIEVRSAGFQTTEDFYLDWLQRRRRIEIELEVFIHAFRPVESARFLHVRVHRGYTSDRSKAAMGEPEALSRADLEELTRRAGMRRDDEMFLARARRSIGLRAKDAALRGDLVAYRAIGAELALLGGAAQMAGTAVG